MSDEHRTDDDKGDDNGNDNTARKATRRRPRTRWIVMGIAGALVLVIAGTTWSTVGFTKRGDDRFGWFVEKKIERMLDKVEASDDQRGKVHGIVKAAVADLQEVHDLKIEIRQDLMAAFSRETVDRDELESLRQRKMETVDRMSQRALTALADAAEVLTPAQRQELVTKWESHRRHHHRHD